MELLPFVAWMVLYPIASSISSYLGTIERLKLNEKPPSLEVRAISSFINMILWFFVGIKLFNHAVN